MATYTVRYQSDLGRVFSPASVSAFTVTDNGRSVSPSGVDAVVFPAIFQDALLGVGEGCSLPFTPRSVRAYLSETDYVSVPCPFIGGSPQFIQFFEQVRARPDVLFAVLDGEEIGDFFVRILTGQQVTRV